MPHGQKDFWPGTSVAMPAAGAGQIPWYMSEAHLVNSGETYDLINYVVPDNMELHVCSGVVSCGTPRTQRYDLRQTPAGTWISPTGHSDPDNGWAREEEAYDGSLLTYAEGLAPRSDWTSFLILTINPAIIDTLRFYAHYAAGTIEKVDLDVYDERGWTDIYEGAFSDRAWVEKSIGADHLVSKAKIRFYNSYADWTAYAQLYEFQFNTAGVTAQKGIWVDTHAIIPYTAEAPYIVEPKATFVVKVYNDDDLNSNMSVALAGFLQPAVL